MASRLTDIVLKIIADSKGVAAGLQPAIGELDKFAGKAEATTNRVNRSFKSLVPPDVRQRAGIASSLANQRAKEESLASQQQRADVLKRAGVASSLAKQREREEALAQQRQRAEVTKRASVAASLAKQREQESRAAVQQGQKRSQVAFSLAEQKRAELAANPSFLKGLGQDAGGLAKGAASLGGAVVTGVVSGIVTASISSILNTVTNVATQVLSAGLDAVREAASKALTEGIQREDNEVSFGALLGSRDRGNAIVDRISKLAIDTPFSSKELLDQSKLLISYGIESEKLVGTLSRLGDVASGAGVDLGRLSLAYGQVVAKGRLQGGEIRQFTEAGVGVRDFANAFQDVTGKRVSTTQFLKLSEEGQVSAAVVERAFERMTSAGGRFFGLMEDRSKTFGGRLQALKESIDVLFGKVGKSFIDNTSAGRFLDRTAGQVQNIDTKGLDQFFRSLDGTLGSALTRAGNGAAGALGLKIPSAANFDFDSFDKRLRVVTNETIPSILDAGRDIAAAFLDASATVLRFGSVLDSLIPEDKLTAAERALFEQKKQNALEVANGIGRGSPRRTRQLEEDVERINRERADRAAQLAERGKIDPVNVADLLERNAAALRLTRPGADFRNAAKAPGDFLDGIIGEKNNRLLQGGLDIAGKAFSDPANLRAQQEAARLNALNRERFKAGEIGERLPTVTGVDITNATKALDSFGGTIKDRTTLLRDAFESIGRKIMPDFGKRVEDLTARLSKPAELPFTDFQRNLGVVNQLDSPLFRSQGRGISAAEGERLRGELGKEILERFKPIEIKAAPLVRANTQEAESALTRAILENQNAGKSAQERLTEAIDQARKAEEENSQVVRQLSDALRGGQVERDPFGAQPQMIGFPP